MKRQIIGAVLLAIAMVFASGETLANAAIALTCLVAGVCVIKAGEKKTLSDSPSIKRAVEYTEAA